MSSPPSTPKPPKAPALVTINRLFKLLLWINSGLCVGTLIVMVAMAFDPSDPLPKHREKIPDTCIYVFTTTAGAFIGLLGGRAGAPDKKG